MSVGGETAFWPGMLGTLSEMHDRVAGLLQDRGRARVLEIGCGTGHELAELAERFPTAEFTGVDISERNIAVARAHYSPVQWSTCDYLAFDGGTFDIIAARSAFQYIRGDDILLAQKLAADVRPSGVIVAELPYDCVWNRCLIVLRRALLRLRFPQADTLLLRIATLLYPGWSQAALAARLEYFYLPTHRVSGRKLDMLMAHAGLAAAERFRTRSPSIAKLRHELVLFRRY
jgi:SAM-dependent methyltransferase